MTIQQAFDFALQNHRAGRLADAEALYRKILAAQPGHAGALHHLGVIALQVGRHDMAVGWIRQAIAVNPNDPGIHYNLGGALRAGGQFDEAMAAFRRTLELRADYPEAWNGLGAALVAQGRLDEAVAAYRRALQARPDFLEAQNNLGNALREQGRLDEAISAYRRALELQPDCAEVHSNLGIALKERGQLDAAVAAFQRALDLKPGFPEAHSNLGGALKDLRRLDEAVAAYRRALELRADCPETHNGLGTALEDLGRLDDAIASFRRALELKPKYAVAHFNLGNVHRKRGGLDEAIAEYRHAVAAKPGFPEAHNNLGNALWERGQIEESIAAYHHALQIRPDDAEFHNNLGHALREQGRLDEAMAACRRALQIRPDYPDAHTNLGIALRDQGQLDEAIAAHRRALEVRPDFPDALNNLGNALKDAGQLDEAIESYRRALEITPGNASAHSNLVYTLHFHPSDDSRAIGEEHRRWTRRFSDPLKPFIPASGNDRSAERRLRIGYVSPDFRDHVVGRNLIPLMERHDQGSFEILCYSGVVREDELTCEFRRRARQWRNTAGVGDEALAEMIRRDGVDILVDLTQHMAGNRLPVFARKPAPVQVSFAGYPETTGLEAIEHRISDRYLEAGSVDDGAGRKERVSLIDSFWCYDPCGAEVKVNPLPASESGKVTFGCLNNFCKVNERMLRLWARVLGAVTDSRLVLLAGAGSHRQRALETLAAEGVEGNRVEFVEYRPRREYLESYHGLDIVLDTAPYNGHTTSLDALWMGVPVVSLAGNAAVSRAGLSQLSNLGLPELAADSEEHYVRIAVDLARDVSRLAALRSTLRHRMENSVLMDAAHFARQVERAYREMWQGNGPLPSLPG